MIAELEDEYCDEEKEALKARRKHLDALLLFRDPNLAKAVTGVRRCGKSSLL